LIVEKAVIKLRASEKQELCLSVPELQEGEKEALIHLNK
jgi:hypothetical protein